MSKSQVPKAQMEAHKANKEAEKNNNNTPDAKLKEDVAAKYNCVGVKPGLVNFLGRDYDLSKINVDTADDLFELGLPYLELKEKTEKADKKA